MAAENISPAGPAQAAKRCVFCGSAGKLTNEHLIPWWLESGAASLPCPAAGARPRARSPACLARLGGGVRDGGWAGEGRPAGGHALAILPGTTHYNVGDSPLFATVTLAFLDQPGPAEG